MAPTFGFANIRCRIGQIMFGSIFRLERSLTLRFIVIHYNCKQYKYTHWYSNAPKSLLINNLADEQDSKVLHFRSMFNNRVSEHEGVLLGYPRRRHGGGRCIVTSCRKRITSRTLLGEGWGTIPTYWTYIRRSTSQWLCSTSWSCGGTSSVMVLCCHVGPTIRWCHTHCEVIHRSCAPCNNYIEVVWSKYQRKVHIVPQQ